MSGVEGNEERKKSRATGWLRIAVSIAVLAVISLFAPIGELVGRMREVSPILWLGVLGGFLVGHAFAAAKWRWMIGGGLSYPRALKAHFAGLAANLALPGVAGGDLVRAGIVMKGSDRKTALAIGSLGDRLIDTASLIVIAAIGAFWLGARAGVSPALIGAAAAATILAAAVSILAMKPIARFIRSRSFGGKIGKLSQAAADALEELADRRGALVGCAAISIVVQAGFALLNALIARDIGVGSSFAAWLFAWPLAKLVATLPISFGGLGVREASIASLMAPLGYPAAGVVAASLIWQTILYAAGAIGALAQSIKVDAVTGQAEASHG